MSQRIISYTARTVLIVAVLLTFSCTAQESEHIRLIDKSEYLEMAESEGVQLLDVRTDKEYQDGHIPEAINIDFFSADFIARCEQEFDRSRPLILYCQAGGRSAKAAKQLAEAGFQTLCDIDGGYGSWEK